MILGGAVVRRTVAAGTQVRSHRSTIRGASLAWDDLLNDLVRENGLDRVHHFPTIALPDELLAEITGFSAHLADLQPLPDRHLVRMVHAMVHVALWSDLEESATRIVEAYRDLSQDDFHDWSRGILDIDASELDELGQDEKRAKARWELLKASAAAVSRLPVGPGWEHRVRIDACGIIEKRLLKIYQSWGTSHLKAELAEFDALGEDRFPRVAWSYRHALIASCGQGTPPSQVRGAPG